MTDIQPAGLSPVGMIFNIQRYTIHDGPGIRTELFLKGCPLRCAWCSNPESQSLARQVGIYPGKCIGKDACGACLAVCPKACMVFEDGKIDHVDRNLCTGGCACVRACPADALKAWGERMDLEETMAVIRRDKSYYDRSGGGVTVSGGEPMTQAPFVQALMERCHAEGIHTCVESTLYTDWEKLKALLPVTDLFITDIKVMDKEKHQKYTGVNNERILSNMKRLVEAGADLIVRIPVIPGVNDDDDNMQKSADFILHELGGKIRGLQLLQFMRLGEEKYRSLDRPYPMEHLKDLDRDAFNDKVKAIAAYMNGRGIPCTVGTTTKED